MMPSTRRFLLKYSLYFLIACGLTVLQNIPGLFAIGEWKPMLTAAFAFCVALYEGEIAGSLFGVAAGLMCDTFSSYKYGFYAMMMLAACMMFGLLARTYMRRVAVNAVLFTLAGMVVIQFCGAFFSLLIWEYEGAWGYFLRRYLPMCVYTAVSAVPCYYLVRLIHSRTDPQKSDRPID